MGDNDNDYSMLEFANISVVMANGKDELKKIADFVTDDNDHGGIKKAIEKYI
ncbi:MAG: HAD hydrolase family protein [Tissierellia bacterium]|nr:HAD hydrolase family protein [Tissierellia bacterium]